MQKKINIILLITVLGMIAYLSVTYKNKKVAYINVSELYNEFQMKLELENQIIQVQNKRKNLLDSLAVDIERRANQLLSNKSVTRDEQQEFDYLRKTYLAKQKQFEEDNLRVSQDYQNKITTRMNEYVIEYAKKNEMDYLFGATGQGNIMYAKEENDITKEVIKYINDKYKGNS